MDATRSTPLAARGQLREGLRSMHRSLVTLGRPVIAAVLAGLAGASVAAGPAPLSTEGSAAEVPWARYGGWPEKDYVKFNTLAREASPPPPAGPVALTGPVEGDAANGEKLAFDRARGGSCVACHVMGPKTPALPGNVGPDLSIIGTQNRPDDYLYNYVYDPRVYNPGTVMPPWGAHGVFEDKEVRDIVAFLKSLREPATFRDPLENPATRPVPKETRDNLDPTENQAMWAVEIGQEVYARKGPTGESCASCHDSAEKAFATWAASMPRFESSMDKVLGIEEFVMRHALATTGNRYEMQSELNTGLSVYLRHVANGTPIQVDLSNDGAQAAVKRAEAMMVKKIGQLNFACTDCHSAEKGANKWIRGQWLGESRGQVPHFPTWRTSRNEIWDIRKRLQWCNVAIRANELPPDAREYGDIELYLASLNNGLPLSVPGIRH